MEEEIQKKLDDILDAISIINDNAATKEDLKAFATKEDLKAFATKEDLKLMELSICDKINIKIGQINGANIELMRKEDNKTLEIVEVMKEKELIDDDDKKRIITMEPFAKSI